MEELSSDVCFVTETWLDAAADNVLIDIETKRGYGHVRRDRPGPRLAGGVAIFYKKSRLSMAPVKIPPSEFELTAAIGRRTGQRRKILALCLYIPPWYDADLNNRCLDHVNQVIRSLRNKYQEPYLVLAGDMNRREIRRAISGQTDLKPVLTDPTRGRHVLDIVVTSFNEYLEIAGVTDPIANDAGTETDHKTVYATFKMPRVPKYLSLIHI